MQKCKTCDCPVSGVWVAPGKSTTDQTALREYLDAKSEDGSPKFSLDEATKKATRYDVNPNMERPAYVEFKEGCIYTLAYRPDNDGEFMRSFNLRDRIRTCAKRAEFAGPSQGIKIGE